MTDELDPSTPATPQPGSQKGTEGDERLDYAEERSVRDIHAAVLREQAEPRDGSEPVSLWLIAFCFVALMSGGYYLGAYSGGFDPGVFDERAGRPAVAAQAGAGAAGAGAQPAEDPLALGKKIFRNCAACHQASGAGMPGVYPSLVGSKIATGAGGRAVRMVIHGAQGPWQSASGNYTGIMTPWGPTLKDKEIAAVINYVRQSWGNSAPPVTVEQVSAIRETTKGQTAPWTYEQLMAEPDELPKVDAPAPPPSPPAAAATAAPPA